MNWQAALRSRLSGVASGRVYWGDRPQADPLPGIALISAGGDWSQHLKGFNLQSDRVQIDSFGRTPEEAQATADAALAALLSGGTFNGHVFSRADVAMPPRSDNERVGNITVFRVSMDLIFHHALA